MTCSLYLPKNRRSFDDKLQRSIAECCTQAERWLRIFNEERTFSLSLKMAPLSLGKKKSKTGRRPWAPGRKIDRPPARPGMYFKTTPTRPARAEKRKGRPPTHWACVIKRPGGRPPGPVGGPAWCYNYTKMALTRAAKWLRFTYGKREFFALFCIPRVLRGRK